MMSAQFALLVLCAATCVQAASSVDNKAKITLACLLGGVPAVSLIMLAVFCVWIKRRQRRVQKDALANGIELGPDGWPAKTATHNVVLPTSVGVLPGNASTTSGVIGGAVDGNGSVPPPAYEAGDGKKGAPPKW
ncbi:unnamed protein product [Rhizoctonia solani]|uniref:Uncharacterized protein n=1 Tax=Rhizoctonia solani TaxID=456999 RepID=A0A8H2XYV0_9AGAM|nr:unnamed protein product [Rhizoctonia solani]